MSLQSFVDFTLILRRPGTPFEFAFAPDQDLFLGNDNNGQVVKITLELISAQATPHVKAVVPLAQTRLR